MFMTGTILSSDLYMNWSQPNLYMNWSREQLRSFNHDDLLIRQVRKTLYKYGILSPYTYQCYSGRNCICDSAIQVVATDTNILNGVRGKNSIDRLTSSDGFITTAARVTQNVPSSYLAIAGIPR